MSKNPVQSTVGLKDLLDSRGLKQERCPNVGVNKLRLKDLLDLRGLKLHFISPLFIKILLSERPPRFERIKTQCIQLTHTHCTPV